MLLNLTVVGAAKLADYVLAEVMCCGTDINLISKINHGTLGNFSTLTYVLDISAEKFMTARRSLLNHLSRPGSPVVCLYEHGAISNVYIFSRTAFKSASETAPIVGKE